MEATHKVKLAKALRVYAKRNNRLRAMGYASYQEYLNSPLWKSIRSRVLERDKGLCIACGNRASVAHHGNYSHAALSGRSIQGIYSLCNRCHEFIEFDKDGRKLHLRETHRKLRWKSSGISQQDLQQKMLLGACICGCREFVKFNKVFADGSESLRFRCKACRKLVNRRRLSLRQQNDSVMVEPE